jgi:hypothetical protein
VLHLAASELAIAVGTEGGAKGITVKDLKVLRTFTHKDCSLFCGLVQQLENRLKIVEKSKNSKLNFAVLSVTRTATLSEYVYTFELQLLIEK